jgi:hypothetical protein
MTTTLVNLEASCDLRQIDVRTPAIYLRHARALSRASTSFLPLMQEKTWLAGTSPAMTSGK